MDGIEVLPKELVEFAEKMTKVSRNLVSASEYYESITIPHAKESNSPVIEAIGEDVTAVRVDLEARAKSITVLATSIEEYADRTTKLHRN